MIFKPMVDEGWHNEHLEVVVLDGVDWLEGFHSRLHEGDLFDADADYLMELDQWLKEKNMLFKPKLAGSAQSAAELLR